MKLNFVELNFNKGKPKASIHLTGKLGFNNEAALYMNLDAQRSYKLATGEDENELYLLEVQSDEGTAKVAKAGKYYYLNVGDAFDRLKIDYKNNTIIFDIKKDTYEGQTLYIMSKRTLPRRKN